MALRKIKKRYYVYYRDEYGRLRTMTLSTSNLNDAQRAHDDFMSDLVKAKTTRKLLMRHGDLFPSGTSLPEAPASNIKKHKRLQLSEMIDTAKKYRNISRDHCLAFGRFCSTFPNLRYADEVTPQIALDYLENNYAGGNGKAYNNNRVMLNTIFRCCLVDAQMKASPFVQVINRLVHNVEHHRALTAEEFKKAFCAAQEPWKTACLISWHTALRLETCFRLAWEHINESDKSITIRPGKTARFGRAVYIPIHPELWLWLQQLPRPDKTEIPILSQWKKQTRFTPKSSQSYFVGLLQSLGINDTQDGKASFHSIRASFITRCDEAGITRIATKGIAGHVDDQITDLYSHDKKTAKQILRLPALGIKSM